MVKNKVKTRVACPHKEQLSFTLEQLEREELLSEDRHLELAETLQNVYTSRVTGHQKYQSWTGA